MKYTYRCTTCGEERIVEKSIEEYTSRLRVYCLNKKEHTRRLMKRVYQPTRAQYIGDGFTGARGAIPHMDKEKRKIDLSSDSGVKTI